MHLKTEKAYVRGLAGGAFTGHLKSTKKVWKQQKQVFWPDLRCWNYLKSGWNTQQLSACAKKAFYTWTKLKIVNNTNLQGKFYELVLC